MEERREDFEDWAQQPANMQLLANILADPGGDHAVAVGQHLQVELRDAHVASIVRALQHELNSAGMLSRSHLGYNSGMALHAILYHLLGGATANIPPPPLVASPEERSRCKDGWAKARPASAAFYTKMRNARDEARSSGSLAPLHNMRSRLFASESHQNLRGGSTTKKAAAGGDGSEPPSVSEAVWRQTTDALVAFAMGTHTRVGEGYASRDGPCAVRLVAGNRDMLRQISDRVRGRPPRTLAPPDRELLRLRRLLWQLQVELQAERAGSEGFRIAFDTERTERMRERRQFESVLNGLAAQLVSQQIASQERLNDAHAAAEAEMKKLRAKLRQVDKKLRQVDRDWKDDATEWQV